MRKQIILFLFLFFCIDASVEQEAFLKANSLYSQKKYDEAIRLYETIENKGSATLHNMGNCYFKMQEYVRAILLWRKAQKNASLKKFESIEKNIALAYDKLNRSYDSATSGFFKKIIYVIPLLTLQLLFLIFWFLLFLIFICLKKLRMLILSVLLPVTIVVAIILIAKYRDELYQRGIVIKKEMALFSGPDTNYHKIGKASMADEVVLLKSDKGWHKIKHGKYIGWVLADTIEII